MSISLMSLACSEGQESTSVIRRLAKTTLPAPISAILETLRDIATMIRLHFWGGAFKFQVSDFEFIHSTRNSKGANSKLVRAGRSAWCSRTRACAWLLG